MWGAPWCQMAPHRQCWQASASLAAQVTRHCWEAASDWVGLGSGLVACCRDVSLHAAALCQHMRCICSKRHASPLDTIYRVCRVICPAVTLVVHVLLLLLQWASLPC